MGDSEIPSRQCAVGHTYFIHISIIFKKTDSQFDHDASTSPCTMKLEALTNDNSSLARLKSA